MRRRNGSPTSRHGFEATCPCLREGRETSTQDVWDRRAAAARPERGGEEAGQGPIPATLRLWRRTICGSLATQRIPSAEGVMKILSVCVALFGVLALVVAEEFHDLAGGGLGVTALISRSGDLALDEPVELPQDIRRHLLDRDHRVRAVRAGRGGALWPAAYAEYMLPVSLPITVAIFSITRLSRRADRSCSRSRGSPTGISMPPTPAQARIWPLPPFTALERRIAVAMVVFLVLINQAQVGITVRLSFFNRDWFNAIQNKDAATFWQLLLLVFTPWAFVYVASTVIEFVIQSMLVIRWRRWLTESFVARWLAGHTHYRMSLTGSEADNPDQRIAEDVNRFIDGGENRRLRHLLLLDPADLDAVVAGVVRHRAVGSVRQLHHSGHRYPRPRFPVLGRAGLCGGRHLDHPSDRPLAGRALFRAPAHGGRLPLLAGAAARIHRAGRAAQRRGAEQASLGRPLRRHHRQLPRAGEPAQEAARLHPDLRADLADHPLHLRRAVLLRRHDRARRDDADRRRLRAGSKAR